jgi:HlyD family secretion protein
MTEPQIDPGVTLRPARRRIVTPVRVAAVVLALVIAGLFAWVRARGPQVDVVPVSRSAVLNRVVASGRALPLARFHLGSVVLGTVARVDAEEGAKVAKAQVLVQLDGTEARAAVAQAKAVLGQAEAKLTQIGGVGARVAFESVRQASARMVQANSDLERERSLLASGASTPERVDAAQKAFEIAVSAHSAAEAQSSSHAPGGGDYRAAASAVAQARAALEAAQARLEQTRIVAPADAVVLTRSVEPGDVVQPGRTLLVLAQTGWTGLTVQVDEKNIALLHLGQTAIASADAFAGERFDAKVVFLAPAVDAARGTLEVKLEVPNPPAYLRPDMTVSVVIDGGKREGVLLVPGSAVRDATSRDPYVMTVEAGRIARREVQLGVRAGDRVEVTQGLEEGASVVVVDGTTLAAGQRVRVRTLTMDEASGAL